MTGIPPLAVGRITQPSTTPVIPIEFTAKDVERDTRADVTMWLRWAGEHAQLIGVDIEEHLKAALAALEKQ